MQQMVVEQVVLRQLIGADASKQRVALQEVAVTARGGTPVAGVLRDLVSADSGDRAMQQAVMVCRCRAAMEKLSVRRGRDAEGKRSDGQGKSEFRRRGSHVPPCPTSLCQTRFCNLD